MIKYATLKLPKATTTYANPDSNRVRVMTYCGRKHPIHLSAQIGNVEYPLIICDGTAIAESDTAWTITVSENYTISVRKSDGAIKYNTISNT